MNSQDIELTAGIHSYLGVQRAFALCREREGIPRFILIPRAAGPHIRWWVDIRLTGLDMIESLIAVTFVIGSWSDTSWKIRLEPDLI